MLNRCLFAVVLLALASAVHAETVWKDRFTVKQNSGNLYLPVDWAAKGGLHLDVRAATGNRHLRLYLQRDQVLAATATAPANLDRKRGLFGTAFGRGSGKPREDEQAIAAARYFPELLPKADLAGTRLVLKVRPGIWTVFIDNQPAMTFPMHLDAPFIVAQPEREVPAKGDPPRFQKVLDYQFAADFMIPEEETNQLGDWQIATGTWLIHTAMEDAVEQKTSEGLARRPLEAERSANFYCLRGNGEGAVITNGYDFLADYEIAASILLNPGRMGLVAYYQDAANYYELTLTVPESGVNKVLMQLRRRSSTRLPRNAILGAAEVEVTPGQWVMPRLQIAGNRIVGYLDNTAIIDVAEPLPVGGKFGLTVSSDGDIRFDDVSVRSRDHFTVDTVDQLRFYLVEESGGFLGAATGPIAPPATSEAKTAIVGSRHAPAHVISARFTGSGAGSEYGLIAGWQGADEPYYRLVRVNQGDAERFALQRVTGAQTTDLETIRLPAPSATQRTVELMLDPSSKGQLRLYRDGELVLIHYLDGKADGASGLYVGPGTAVAIDQVDYRLERRDLHHNLQEKNQIYVTDPFMRHWSSPEGQWMSDADGYMWHKGDLYGRFVLHMPYVSPSTVHLGVKREATVGQVAVRVNGLDLALIASGAGADAPPLATARLPEAAPSITDRAAYAIHRESNWIWITDADDTLLLSYHLAEPLAGHRVRLEGFTFDHLMYSHVETYNQLDYLFSQAPHDWTVNGGRWQIINRFQCDPRWSHFNGQNGENLAALWGKYRFAGDFCVELYAGIRHGNEWYNRTGDINLTIMNRETTAGQGYTVTTTGWDENLSQLWTRLYRNGQEVAKSDLPLIPRRRDGNVLIAPRDPLVGSGRDVHGAWYYLRLSRVGNHLAYTFNNEPVFSYDDPEPLQDGSVGIWTYRNSMMVARVRVTAESIEPRPIAFRLLPPLDEPWQPTVANEVDEEFFATVQDHGQASIGPLPSTWTCTDDIGHSTLAWYVEQRHSPYFVMTNTLGGGDMAALSTAAPVPYKDMAGWRFLLKRTEGARFNLHYTLGTMDGENFVPLRRYYHQISGSSFVDGDYHRQGQTEVPGLARDAADWHRRGVWTPVIAWLPAAGTEGLAADDQLYVRLDGFGALQPSLLQTGIGGNAPGDGYAVQGLAPIRYQRPELSLTDDSRFRTIVMLNPTSLQPLHESRQISEIQHWLASRSRAGLNHVLLRAIGRFGTDLQTELYWVELPAEPAISILWDDREPLSLRLESGVPYVDRRFSRATLTVNELPVALSERSTGVRVGALPRDERLTLVREKLEVVAKTDHRTVSRTLSIYGDKAVDGEPQGTPRPAPPVLVGVDGPFPIVDTFERPAPPERYTFATTASFLAGDPLQGTYLRTANNTLGQRLAWNYNAPFDVARSPILQFRYRASEQADVALNFGDQFFVDLGEKRFYAVRAGANRTAQDVRHGTKLSREPEWHSWIGMLSDVPTRSALNFSLLRTPGFNIGSFGAVDQTGRFSSIDYDDIVCGPAVSTGQQLAFTPRYFSFEGVKSIAYAVYSGATPYPDLTPEARQALVWKTAESEATIVPDLAGLDQGPGHLAIKAIDRGGRESLVTDLPFLYDNQPMTVTGKTAAWSDPMGNGTALYLELDNGGLAPADLTALRFSSGGQPVDVVSELATITHQVDRQILTIDYPYVFRTQLDKLKNGDKIDLVVDQIRDGAGNAVPAVTLPLVVDYAADKEGPAWLPVKYPANVLFATAWEGRVTKALHVEPQRGNSVVVEHNRGEEPYLRTLTYGAAGAVTLKTDGWDVATYPCFAIRLRQPAYRKANPTSLIIQFNGNRNLLLDLTETKTGGAYVTPASPIVWTKDTWVTINLDLHDQIEKSFGRETADKFEIKTVIIKRAGAENQEPLDIQSCFIYAPWRPTTKLALDAYDASGVAGFAWEYTDGAGKVVATGETDSRLFSPAELAITRQPEGWLTLRAKDRAGNLSVPLRLPDPVPGLMTPDEERNLLDDKK